MSGQWAGSDRRQRLPPDWGEIRQRVIARDKVCQWRDNPKEPVCGAPANQVDHINPKTDDHRLAALQLLCEPHHRRKSAREGAAAFHANRRAIRKRFRVVEPHPGATTPGQAPTIPYPWKLLAK